MEIVAFGPEHALPAAELFTQQLRALRRELPLLPNRLEDPACVAGKLTEMAAYSPMFCALDAGQVVGYLGGWVVDDFRATGRKGVYCPEWAHAVEGDAAETPIMLSDTAQRSAIIERALYTAASAAWYAAGCTVHALTLLANAAAARNAWFWNGFGLGVVDGIRDLRPIGAPVPAGYTLRKATLEDIPALADLEAEHWQYYGQPPTLMMLNGAESAADLRAFLERPGSAAWLAWQGDHLAGYLRNEDAIDGGAETITGPGITGITGAYIRPAHRRQGLALALLDQLLADAVRRGYHACSVDFESFNPNAASFWPRYFKLATLSLLRIPEKEPER